MAPYRRLSVGTVDSFQGQERDIIAITLTRSKVCVKPCLFFHLTAPGHARDNGYK